MATYKNKKNGKIKEFTGVSEKNLNKLGWEILKKEKTEKKEKK